MFFELDKDFLAVSLIGRYKILDPFFLEIATMLASLLKKIMYFLKTLTATPHQIRRHVPSGILAVKVRKLSSVEPNSNK